MHSEDTKSKIDRIRPCGIRTQFHRDDSLFPVVLEIFLSQEKYSGTPAPLTCHFDRSTIPIVRSGEIPIPPSVFARLCEAIQDSLRKSSKLSSIFFIETRCRTSWTATSTHKNEFPRGDGGGWTATDFLGRKSFDKDGISGRIEDS